ncbi:hypothetical protein C723_1626 [Christiangramia flava JLT2011]|nr:hypothetical protein C723_1626 [Christiangramia flava JLT2011]
MAILLRYSINPTIKISRWQNFTLKKSSKEETSFHSQPKKETIEFLLNYSKALRITEHKKMQFEMLLN